MKKQLLTLTLFTTLCGCATTTTTTTPTTTKPNPIKLCAQALVTLSVAADCTALAPTGCMFTMADLATVRTAAADKQVFCPTLKPGQEEGNN
jgi:hypothetical protein